MSELTEVRYVVQGGVLIARYMRSAGAWLLRAETRSPDRPVEGRGATQTEARWQFEAALERWLKEST